MLPSTPQIQRWNTEDIDEHARLMTGWDQEYCQISRGKFHGNIAIALNGKACIIRETTNQSLHQFVEPPSDTLVFGLTLGRNDSLTINRQPVSTNSIVALEGGREYDFRTTGQTDMLGIVIDKEVVFGDDGAHISPIQTALQQGVVALDSHAASMLQNLWQIMSNALDNNLSWPGTLSFSQIMETARSTVVLALSLAMNSDTIPRAHSAATERRSSVVRHAIRFMRVHLDQEFTMADVCAAAHVSERTLQYHFESCLGLPPQQYLKAMRLNAARILIRGLGTATDARRRSIAEIAAQCGYEHASRFAGDFRRQFGCLPSESMRDAANRAALAA
ncbi:helix-turn-helix domain-containing protein [Pseudoduganella sp. RAF53_2]|uniref:helix-turn-helix domain-containing protein n=1 Tax=unclassified Pseudoduganella TaxID=2637179 RepID=UPI003F9891D9